MSQKIKTFTNLGMDGYEVDVEVDSSKSLPSIDIVGLPDTVIKESKERIRATFRNFSVDIPPRKIVLNLAPSDLKKVGTRFDLPMALAIYYMINYDNLSSYYNIFENSIFLGELGLDGKVKRINGILPSIISARKKGYKNFFIPYDNFSEVKYIPDINIYLIDSFKDIIDFFYYGKDINVVKNGAQTSENLKSLNLTDFDTDFGDIKGHLFAKRALSISAAGFHNSLMVGAPGSGKSLLAKAFQSILPPLNFDEILEISQIYSIIGKLNEDTPLMNFRPFRDVHHTASKVSITGGGQNLTPGEISLAHKGILFFDELPEFDRQVLEVLRQPLEEGKISISRANGVVEYPSQFAFISAMNPCKCGYYNDHEKDCTCSINEIKRYQNKISGPMLDRFDMILEIPRESADKILDKNKDISSKDLRENVEKAWNIQQERYKDIDINLNSQLSSKNIDDYVNMDNEAENFLKNTMKSLNLSPRVVHRAIKLSRTIADIDGQEKVQTSHIAESMQYRSKNMFVESI